MGKILQLLLSQNIIPRCWKFWTNEGFRIWSNSSNFGADTLRNMSLSWQGVVTEDALKAQSHIVPAAICHWLHSPRGGLQQAVAEEQKWNVWTFTSLIRLFRGGLFILQYFIIPQSCFHIGKTRYVVVPLVPLQGGSSTLQERLWASIWAVFAFAGSMWAPAREGDSSTRAGRDRDPHQQRKEPYKPSRVMWRWYWWVTKGEGNETLYLIENI